MALLISPRGIVYSDLEDGALSITPYGFITRNSDPAGGPEQITLTRDDVTIVQYDITVDQDISNPPEQITLTRDDVGIVAYALEAYHTEIRFGRGQTQQAGYRDFRIVRGLTVQDVKDYFDDL